MVKMIIFNLRQLNRPILYPICFAEHRKKFSVNKTVNYRDLR